VESWFFGSVAELADIVRLSTILDDAVSRSKSVLEHQPKEEFTFVFYRGFPYRLPVLVREGSYELGVVSRFD
jgi:hypothetical protein